MTGLSTDDRSAEWTGLCRRAFVQRRKLLSPCQPNSAVGWCPRRITRCCTWSGIGFALLFGEVSDLASKIFCHREIDRYYLSASFSRCMARSGLKMVLGNSHRRCVAFVQEPAPSAATIPYCDQFAPCSRRAAPLLLPAVGKRELHGGPALGGHSGNRNFFSARFSAPPASAGNRPVVAAPIFLPFAWEAMQGVWRGGALDRLEPSFGVPRHRFYGPDAQRGLREKLRVCPSMLPSVDLDNGEGLRRLVPFRRRDLPWRLVVS